MSDRIVPVLLVLALAAAALAQTAPRTITVSADATIKVTPDTAVASLAIETTGKTVSNAVLENNRIASNVITGVKLLNLTGVTVTTRGFTVQPNYDYGNGIIPMGVPAAAAGGGYGTAQPGAVTGSAPTLAYPYAGAGATTPPAIYPYPGGGDQTPTLSGYTVQNALEIRIVQTTPAATAGTDAVGIGLAATIGKVLDAALKAGANRVDSVQFQLSDDNAKQVMLDLVQKASVNARAIAAAMAAGSGVTLGEVTSLSSGWNSYPYATTYAPMIARAGYGADSAPPIEAGELSYTASVSATFAIK
jgi:uncharacterized protein YggE